MRKLVLTVALSGLVACGLNAATPANGPTTFESHDTNKDGVITEAEFNAAKADRMGAKAEAGMPMRNAGNSPDFSAFDANKDGKVTPEEFQKFQAEKMQTNRATNQGTGMGQGKGQGAGGGQGMGGQGAGQGAGGGMGGGQGRGGANR